MTSDNPNNLSETLRFSLSLALVMFVHFVCSLILFGDIFWPLGYGLVWHDRLPTKYWGGQVFAGLMIGSVAAKLLWSKDVFKIFAPAIFLATSLTFSFFATVVYVDQERKKRVLKFEPDRVIQNSLWLSFHEAPRDFQTYLHAAALKDCIPYAWSYRQMAFYRLPVNAAINVLPRDWVEACNIKRE